MIELTIATGLREIAGRLVDAAAIAKGAVACAESGSEREALQIAMDLDELIGEAAKLHGALCLLGRTERRAGGWEELWAAPTEERRQAPCYAPPAWPLAGSGQFSRPSRLAAPDSSTASVSPRSVTVLLVVASPLALVVLIIVVSCRGTLRRHRGAERSDPAADRRQPNQAQLGRGAAGEATRADLAR